MKYFKDLKIGDEIFVANIHTVMTGMELTDKEREEVKIWANTSLPVVRKYFCNSPLRYRVDKIGNEGAVNSCSVYLAILPQPGVQAPPRPMFLTYEQYTKCDVFFNKISNVDTMYIIATTYEGLEKGIKKAIKSIMLYETTYLNIKMSSLSEIMNSI